MKIKTQILRERRVIKLIENLVSSKEINVCFKDNFEIMSFQNICIIFNNYSQSIGLIFDRIREVEMLREKNSKSNPIKNDSYNYFEEYVQKLGISVADVVNNIVRKDTKEKFNRFIIGTFFDKFDEYTHLFEQDLSIKEISVNNIIFNIMDESKI